MGSCATSLNNSNANTPELKQGWYVAREDILVWPDKEMSKTCEHLTTVVEATIPVYVSKICSKNIVRIDQPFWGYVKIFQKTSDAILINKLEPTKRNKK
eukprot:UN28390